MPINQISQQINAIVMALAGAERIFALLDEEPEADGGYVELVNAKESEDGTIIESKERTGLWAWKHFHQEDGTTTYRKLQGKVIFDHVDFGYNEDKIILHDIEMYAQPGQKIAFVGATVPVRRRSQISSTVSMIFRTVRSDMMISMSIRSRKKIYDCLLELFYRIRICLQEQ